MTSELFKEWHAWATDRLAQPRSPAAAHSYEYWLELKVGRLASDKSALEQRVEGLETQTRLMAGELSTYGRHKNRHPEYVLEEFAHLASQEEA